MKRRTFGTLLSLSGLSALCQAQDVKEESLRRFVVRSGSGASEAGGKDTEAFQTAINACHAAGGGVVSVPPGDYVIGRVFLKDNVTLELEAGCVVRPSTDQTDYPPFEWSPESHYQPQSGENALNNRYAMICAFKARNIALRGPGKLVGEGKTFWQVKNTGEYEKWNTVAPWHYYKPNAFRPLLVLFEECENTLVSDMVFEDSSCYTGWFAGCRNMRFMGTLINNDLTGPNTDGFHFSSCVNVHLTDCHFVCGDDCIAIDPNYNGPSSNYTITGCTFNTSVNVFRIYTGLDPLLAGDLPRGTVSDISAANCSVEDASGVFNVTAEKGDIERLTFTNFTVNMKQRGSAFFFLTLKGGRIRDVVLSHMTALTDGIGTISGEDGGSISGITLDDLRYGVEPRTKLYGNGMPDPLPSYALHHFAPYNLYIRHACDLSLHNLSVDWRNADLADLGKIPGSKASWSCIEMKDVQRADLDGASCPPFGTEAPALMLTDVADIHITRCRIPEKIETFLSVGGSASNIRLADNDLSKAGKEYQLQEGVSPGTVVLEGASSKDQ